MEAPAPVAGEDTEADISAGAVAGIRGEPIVYKDFSTLRRPHDEGARQCPIAP